MIGLIIRLIFTNFTAAHAAAVKAAGGNVGQNVLRETVVWWVVVPAIGAFVLAKTKYGNWIFAVGGNRDAARAIGVPAGSVKISLFVSCRCAVPGRNPDRTALRTRCRPTRASAWSSSTSSPPSSVGV